MNESNRQAEVRAEIFSKDDYYNEIIWKCSRELHVETIVMLSRAND